jgi:hypothetical protein
MRVVFAVVFITAHILQRRAVAISINLQTLPGYRHRSHPHLQA